jgi:hypothetical protein
MRPIEVQQRQPSTGFPQGPFEVGNDDAFAFPLLDMQTHGRHYPAA